MQIIKRNGEFAEFDKNKIIRAINKAILDMDHPVKIEVNLIADKIEEQVKNSDVNFTVENIQDEVVKSLMDLNKDLAIKYQSYRTMREGKRNFERMYEEKIGQLLGKDKSILHENANKDAKTISVQRDLLAGISSKNYYLNNILPKNIAEAHEKGEIHVHDLDYLIFKETNCLGRETEFATSDGVKSFEDFENGDKIVVLTPYGEYKKATVVNLGKQNLNHIVFSRGNEEVIIRATKNHRWLLNDNTITENLKIGDKLYVPNFINSKENWIVKEIMYTDEIEDVWCLDVEDVHLFMLSNEIPTGNCELLNLERMLKGGCKIGNAKMLEPNSVDVAVGHIIQIIASVSSNTYGGCTAPYLDEVLIPYVRKTFMKHFFNGYKFFYGSEIDKKEFLYEIGIDYFGTNETWEKVYNFLEKEYNKVYRYATELTEDSVKQAMQGLEYEINSLSTVNG